MKYNRKKKNIQSQKFKHPNDNVILKNGLLLKLRLVSISYIADDHGMSLFEYIMDKCGMNYAVDYKVTTGGKVASKSEIHSIVKHCLRFTKIILKIKKTERNKLYNSGFTRTAVEILHGLVHNGIRPENMLSVKQTKKLIKGIYIC